MIGDGKYNITVRAKLDVVLDVTTHAENESSDVNSSRKESESSIIIIIIILILIHIS